MFDDGNSGFIVGFLTCYNPCFELLLLCNLIDKIYEVAPKQ